jgi:multiple antibiotic resistance protein
LRRVGDFIQSFAMTYAALFPIANPLGNAAIFLSITDGEKAAERHSQALKGSLYMFGILLLFFIGGNFIMRFFGITLDGIRVAGGLVVAHVGFKLMNPKKADTHGPEEEAEAKAKPDISLSPLAIPLLAGPGSMAVVMSFSSFHESIYSQGMLGMLAGIFAVCATCWIMLRQADSVLGVLGVNGANALTKIMAFLLLAIGVQLAMNGGQHWLQQTFAAAKP